MKQHTVIKNSLITAGILGAATGFCFLIQEAAESDTHVPLLFVLAVLFISRFTDGYISVSYTHLDVYKRQDWNQVSVLNTAAAAKKVMEEGDKTQAAVASRTAGELYGLAELKTSISNERGNTTRFLVLSREPRCV